jgi:hypothetical protein
MGMLDNAASTWSYLNSLVAYQVGFVLDAGMVRRDDIVITAKKDFIEIQESQSLTKRRANVSRK